LQDQFELDKPTTIKQIGKMIGRGVISAKVDPESGTLVFDTQSGTGS